LRHSGACLLAHCRPLQLNAIFFEHQPGPAGSPVERVIAAAGSITNLTAGPASLAWLRLRPPAAGTGRLFVWLLVAVNLTMPAAHQQHR
jgi:hypothetical protein